MAEKVLKVVVTGKGDGGGWRLEEGASLGPWSSRALLFVHALYVVKLGLGAHMSATLG